MSRTQRIDISWLNERYSDGDFEFIDCPSEYQAADIFTKFFTDGKVWTRNLRLIGIFGKKVLISQGAKDACPAAAIITAVCRAALFIKRIRERMIPVRMTCDSAGHQGRNCNQVVFDFCSKEGNRISIQANANNDCKVIRITADDEARIDDETVAIMRSSQFNKALLFSDIPCVNGNNWNFIRQLTEPERKSVHDQMKVMKQRWTIFNDICSIAKECNLSLVIDWPVACTYWKKVDVGNLLSRLDLKPVDIHGCALALVSVSDDSRGKLIKKHWRFRLIVLRLPIPCVTRLAVVTMIMLHAKVVTLSIVSCTLMILLSACLGHLSVQSSSKCNS
jgi:hypothetical protein